MIRYLNKFNKIININKIINKNLRFNPCLNNNIIKNVNKLQFSTRIKDENLENINYNNIKDNEKNFFYPSLNFNINPNNIKKFKEMTPPFGFNGLGEFVYERTYARLKNNKSKRENWYDTIKRVVNGTFSIQKYHIINIKKQEWDEEKAQKSATEMFERIFDMRFLPPGRGLWAMGSELTHKRHLFAALNNCAFVSTENIHKDLSEPFTFLMDASMLGVGVGFDTLGANKIKIKKPNKNNTLIYNIPDSREGWVKSIKLLLESYFTGDYYINFEYDLIRKEGEPIKGFGGVAQGPQILKDLHNEINDILTNIINKNITSTIIVDIMNLIGKCVVAGNVRRTAEIAFGDPDDEDYINLKDYNINPKRSTYGWTSNNSIFAKLGMDYTKICEKIDINGEPGLAWLDNMRNYGRMNGIIDQRDINAKGGNPCLEQTLESYELCCLVETFPNRHKDLDDYLKTLKYAILYAKTVTLGPTHWNKTNDVMLKNRRIGCSMSGLAQFLSDHNIDELRQWCDEGYNKIQKLDQKYSNWFNIPKSIKTTCIKPSGTVSLLAGATPGMHFPESRFYIRRIRISKESDLLNNLIKKGYYIEECKNDPNHSMVVEIPVDIGKNVKTLDQVSLWEQLSFAAFLQRYWADNQVSCTVTYKPNEESHMIKPALDYFQYLLKGVSFLPKLEHGAYEQMPYEKITEEEYNIKLNEIKNNYKNYDYENDLDNILNSDDDSELLNDYYQYKNKNDKKNIIYEHVPDQFCDSDTCFIDDPFINNNNNNIKSENKKLNNDILKIYNKIQK